MNILKSFYIKQPKIKNKSKFNNILKNILIFSAPILFTTVLAATFNNIDNLKEDILATQDKEVYIEVIQNKKSDFEIYIENLNLNRDYVENNGLYHTFLNENSNLSASNLIKLAYNLKLATDLIFLKTSSNENYLENKLHHENQKKEAYEWLNEAYSLYMFHLNNGTLNELRFKNNNGLSDEDYKYILEGELNYSLYNFEKHNIEKLGLEDKNINLSMTEKENIIIQLIDEVGFSGMEISHNIYSDDNLFLKYVEALKKSNDDLKIITGLDGRVLGLNGRVFFKYDVFQPRVELTSKKLLMATPINSLAHEWFHALEFTLSTQLNGVNRNQAIFELRKDFFNKSPIVFDRFDVLNNIENLKRSFNNLNVDSELSNSIKKEINQRAENYANKEMVEYSRNNYMFSSMRISANISLNSDYTNYNGSPWLLQRELTVKILKNNLEIETDPNERKRIEYSIDYISSNSEIFASAFNSYATLKKNEGYTNLLKTDFSIDNGIYLPTIYETSHQKHNWEVFFKGLETFWQEDTNNRKYIINNVYDNYTLNKNNILAKRIKDSEDNNLNNQQQYKKTNKLV